MCGQTHYMQKHDFVWSRGLVFLDAAQCFMGKKMNTNKATKRLQGVYHAWQTLPVREIESVLKQQLIQKDAITPPNIQRRHLADWTPPLPFLLGAFHHFCLLRTRLAP